MTQLYGSAVLVIAVCLIQSTALTIWHSHIATFVSVLCHVVALLNSIQGKLAFADLFVTFNGFMCLLILFATLKYWTSQQKGFKKAEMTQSGLEKTDYMELSQDK